MEHFQIMTAVQRDCYIEEHYLNFTVYLNFAWTTNDYSARRQASAEYWKQFMARFDGVHARVRV